MPVTYTTDQFWKIYEKLPQELQDYVAEPETGDLIYEICAQNDIADYHDNILRLCTATLIGLLPPKDFQKELEPLGLTPDLAAKVSREITRLIFYPVKPVLQQLYAPVEEKGSTEEKRGENSFAPTVLGPETAAPLATLEPSSPPEQPSQPRKIFPEEFEEEPKKDEYREPAE